MNIVEAGKSENIEKVRELIAKGENVNVLRDLNKRESLLHITLGKNIELFKLLVQSGADVNAVDYHGNTLLHVAFQRTASNVTIQKLCHMYEDEMVNYEEYVSICIDAGIDINRRNSFQLSPLHITVSNDLDEYTRKLINNPSIDFEVQDRVGNTPVHLLAKMNKIDILSEIVDKGTDINFKNFDKLTPFEISLQADPCAIDCFKFLLSKNIDVNHRGKYGNTALHTAVEASRLHHIALFLINQESVELNIQNDNGDTVAHLAVKNRAIEILTALMKRDVDLNIVNNFDKTVLDLSVDSHDKRIIALLLSKNVDVNRQNAKGDTTLHVAVSKHHLLDESVKQLLKSDKVNLNLQNNYGYTPLMIAVGKNDVQCVEWLIGRSCDVNILSNNGNTALMIAAKKQEMNEKRKKIIEMLINEEKADLYIPSNDVHKHPCLNKVVLEGNFHVAKCLLAKDVKLGDVKDNFSNLPIHIAASKGHYALIQLLLSKMYPEIINAQGWHLWTPLHFAICNNQFNIVELLILKNANCNVPDIYGNTPLHYAMRFYSECCATNNAECSHKDELDKCKQLKQIWRYNVNVLNLNCAYHSLIWYLVEKGNADVYIKNGRGETPNDWKKSNGVSNKEFWSKFLLRNKFLYKYTNE